ncbi:MAG: rod shape-determining protein RodA [Verrucomicrobia bacterium]|nr:rod shape-determining protein RodA [Verrucomicrobiota bacterium]
MMLCLCSIGVAFIYSAQYAGHVPFSIKDGVLRGIINLLKTFWFKQVFFIGTGAMLYLFISLIDYRVWLSLAHWFYLACLVPLVLVLFIGNEVYGASRWLDLGFFNFQPSETAKAAVLLIVASILARSQVGTIAQSLGVLGKLALAVGLPMLLILLQPDLKSAIVLPPMVFSMLYVSRLSTRFFAGALGAFLLVVGVVALDSYNYVRFMEAHDYSYIRDKGKYETQALFPLHDYQRNRILTFVAPDVIDPTRTKDAWNLTQSQISIGSGGLTGKGWTKGTQAQLGYLPSAVAHNDFIFSVIAEEEGFLGSLTVLSLFGVVMFNGVRIAGLARDRFGKLLAIGVTVLFAVHVFVNIAMTFGMVPITGIPLPFISYGGSFVLSCCLLQGLVQSVYRFRKDFS